MTVSLSQVSVPAILQGLNGLAGVLEKAKAQAAAKNIDPAALLQARLYPDMFSLTRQVQIASDFGKGAAGRLAGADLPSWEDNEASFDDLIGRVKRTIAYVEGLNAADIDGQEDREITLVRRGEEMKFKAQAYLLHQALPNFYFHLTTAYAILRHNGVEIGKKDFLAAG